MPLEKLLVKRMENEWDPRKPRALEPDNPGLIPSSATHLPAVGNCLLFLRLSFQSWKVGIVILTGLLQGLKKEHR